MNKDIWQIVAIGFFGVQTMSAIILVEFLVFGKPYVTLFGMIFLLTLHFNLKKYPELPIARRWPFLKK